MTVFVQIIFWGYLSSSYLYICMLKIDQFYSDIYLYAYLFRLFPF